MERRERVILHEWMGDYRLLGAGPIEVLTNDCTDLMLDRLQDLGPVTHIRNIGYGSDSPQIHNVRMVMEQVEAGGQAEWCLHVDSDEFLDVTCGDGRVDDLMDLMPPTKSVAIAREAVRQ